MRGIRLRAVVIATLLALVSVPARAPATPASFVVMTEYFTYIPGDADKPSPALTITQGSSLTLVNVDPLGGEHSVTADETTNGVPSFDSELIDNPGQTAVVGVERLAPGDYGFHCRIHFWLPMRGILHIVA